MNYGPANCSMAMDAGGSAALAAALLHTLRNIT
jgi:hypothetical protein